MTVRRVVRPAEHGPQAHQGHGSEGRDEQDDRESATRQFQGVETAHHLDREQQHEPRQHGGDQHDPSPGQRDGQQDQHAQAEDERHQGGGRALLHQRETAGPAQGIRRERRRGDDGPGRDGEAQYPVDEPGEVAPRVGRQGQEEGRNADGQRVDDRQMPGQERVGQQRDARRPPPGTWPRPSW